VSTPRQSQASEGAAGVARELDALRGEVERLAATVTELATLVRGEGRGPRFTRADARFLIFTLGFTAGAHMERDARKAERVFAWCSALHDKLEAEAGNGS